MARIKVKLQDTSPARFVWIDPKASQGATLGIDLFTPDSKVGTPATVRAWLGVVAAPNLRDTPAGQGTMHHRLLQGLTLGDDHPQYTQWVQDEIVTGAWHFRTYDGILIENPDLLENGIELTTISGPDPVNDGIGNQLAFWEGDGYGVNPFRSFGFRIRHTGEINNEGNLDWYRHVADVNGVLFMRFTRDSSQVQFAAGAVDAPVWTTLNDLNTGMYFPAADAIGWTTGGVLRLTAANAGITATVPYRGADGSATAPTYGFTSDPDTGIYLGATGSLGITHSGVFRVALSATLFSVTLPIQGAAGSVGTPEFSFTSDPNTGMYSIGDDILGFATAGAERFRIAAAGQWGLAGANYGAAGQVLTSNGVLAAPTWQSGGAGIVQAVISGHGIGVDDYADPTNPIVSVDESDVFRWTGTHIFAGTGDVPSATSVTIRGSNAGQILQSNFSSAAGARNWDSFVTAGGALTCRVMDDALAASATWLSVARSGTTITSLTLGNAVNNPTFTFAGTGRITAGGVVRLPGYTVATLPAGTGGDTAYVTDALAPAFGAAVVGGGAVTIPVFYDGTNWIVG